jgi:hypothetical protein
MALWTGSFRHAKSYSRQFGGARLLPSVTSAEQSIRWCMRGRSPRNSVYLRYDECVPERSQHISESAEATRCDVASYISSFPFHGPGDNAFHRYGLCGARPALAAHGVHRLVLYAVAALRPLLSVKTVFSNNLTTRTQFAVGNDFVCVQLTNPLSGIDA